MWKEAFATFPIRLLVTLIVALTLTVRAEAEIEKPVMSEYRIRTFENKVLRLETAALETRQKRYVCMYVCVYLSVCLSVCLVNVWL